MQDDAVVVQDDGVESRKVLSKRVLPAALQWGVGRQCGSWEASMSRHTHSHALTRHMPRQGFAKLGSEVAYIYNYRQLGHEFEPQKELTA